MDDKRKNVKVKPDLWRLLRLIAATTSEQQQAVLARLLTKEWDRLQRQPATKES